MNELKSQICKVLVSDLHNNYQNPTTLEEHIDVFKNSSLLIETITLGFDFINNKKYKDYLKMIFIWSKRYLALYERYKNLAHENEQDVKLFDVKMVEKYINMYKEMDERVIIDDTPNPMKKREVSNQIFDML